MKLMRLLLGRLLKLPSTSEEPNVRPMLKRNHRRKKNDQDNDQTAAAQRPPQSLRTPDSPLRRRSDEQPPITAQVESVSRQGGSQGFGRQHHAEAAYSRPRQPSVPHNEAVSGSQSLSGHREYPSGSATVRGQTPLSYDAASRTTPYADSGTPEDLSVNRVLPAQPRVADSGILEPPVFGSSPPAAKRPWLLPNEPSVSGVAADQASLGDLDVRAVSIVGPGHRCEEPALPRQDSYRLGRDRAGRYLIIAVADGMSDSRRSDLGATVAARCAVDTLREYFDRGDDPTPQVMNKVFRAVSGAMVAAAKNEGLSEMDIRCALIVAVIPSDSNGPSLGRRAWFASLADVSAWLRHGDGWRRLAGDEKNDNLDRNILHDFLPYHPDRAVTTFYDLEPGATVAIMTDGVGDAFTDIPGAARWFAQRWEKPVTLESFLLDVGFQARGQLDDRTSVTVWCRDSARSRQ
jgi:hypothetical protein